MNIDRPAMMRHRAEDGRPEPLVKRMLAAQGRAPGPETGLLLKLRIGALIGVVSENRRIRVATGATRAFGDRPC